MAVERVRCPNDSDLLVERQVGSPNFTILLNDERKDFFSMLRFMLAASLGHPELYALVMMELEIFERHLEGHTQDSYGGTQ